MLKSCALRIFVVDDRQVIAATLATILNQSGHEATYFTNPLEALAMAAKDAPDYLISDVIMPELSGIDLAIHVTRQCPGCTILLFSGQANSEDLLLDARQQGWDFELLCKPVHPTEILRRVQERAKQKYRSVRHTSAEVNRSKLKDYTMNSQSEVLAACYHTIACSLELLIPRAVCRTPWQSNEPRGVLQA